MPTREIPAGFIPKKLACEKFRRSFRQLTRDLSLATQAKDEKILEHFNLVLEDGDVISGVDVTTDRISTLRDEGRNPMWFVRESWMEKTYGRKESREEGAQSKDSTDMKAGERPLESPQSDILGLYENQIERFEKEVAWLREEVKIKNEQIRDANERQKETHVLTRDLHGLMSTMQERLLPAPQTAMTIDAVAANDEPESTPQADTATSATRPTRKRSTGTNQRSRGALRDTPKKTGKESNAASRERKKRGTLRDVLFRPLW